MKHLTNQNNSLECSLHLKKIDIQINSEIPKEKQFCFDKPFRSIVDTPRNIVLHLIYDVEF